MAQEFQKSAVGARVNAFRVTPNGGLDRLVPRNCGTFAVVNRKYHRRTGSQQRGTKVGKSIVNAGSNPRYFQLHLFGTNGWGQREMWQQAGNLGRISRFVSRAAILLVACALLFAGVQSPAQAQGVQTVLHARGRVFPDVGRGAEAIERDAAGHYYVLADPASIIWIYNAEGTRIGQIPTAQAREAVPAAAIKFAVDFDRDAASGRIFVADRGANAVKIYTPDGALEANVRVNAPMSVVALANGEFAVLTLRSDHLVRVMNEHGKLLRSFGNISDAVNDPSQLTVPALSVSADSEAGYAAGYPTGPPPAYAMDVGKLYSGGAGDIYFVFTSLKDPKFRKYDRFGYAGYEAEISANSLIPDINHDKSQVQLGMRISGMAGPGEMFSFGSMYSVGGGGPIFTANGGHGGGRRGGSAAPGGTGGTTTSGAAGSTGTANGDSSDSDPTTNATASAYGSDLSGSLSATSDSGKVSSNYTYDDTPDFNALLGVGGPGGGFGAPGIFGPGAFPGFGGFGGGFEHHTGADGPGGPSSGAAGAVGAEAGAAGSPGSHFTGGPASGGGVESAGAGHGEYGEYHRGFRQDGLNSFAGVVKFTEREPDVTAKPVIHALGVDGASQQVWAAIDDMLLHFDRDGNLLDIYRVATSQGAALQPVGILVEPDRILLVADPAGIYEFARPDKTQLTGKQAPKPESPAP